MTESRRERILAALRERRFLSVQEVAALMECSLTTARRDLTTLALEGYLQRTHGGAVTAPRQPPPLENAPDPFGTVKQRIAAAAAALIADGDTVGLTGGSTMLAIARQVRGRRIGVLTNSVEVAIDLVTAPNSRVMLLGGMLSPVSHEIVGPEAEEMLARVSIDTLFMGVDGISAALGATTNGALEAQIMRAMAAQARRVIIAADRRKVGRAALSRIVPIEGIAVLVTEAHATPALEAIRSAGVEVIEA